MVNLSKRGPDGQSDTLFISRPERDQSKQPANVEHLISRGRETGMALAFILSLSCLGFLQQLFIPIDYQNTHSHTQLIRRSHTYGPA